MKTKQIDFIGIGANKSATSWVADCLNEHPDIFVPEIKELRYFGKIYKFYVPDGFIDQSKNGIDWYLKYFEKATKNQIKGEFTPSYLYHPDIARAIHGKFPDAKLIIILRDPIERLYSYYMHIKAKDKYFIDTFENILKNEPRVLDQGLYYEHIENYLRYFRAEHIHIGIYEDIQKDPHAFISQIYKFLNVDEYFHPNSVKKIVNSTREKMTNSHKLKRRIVKKIRSLPAGKQSLKFAKKIGATKVGNLLLKSKPASYSSMSLKTREMLSDYYRCDNEQLAKMLDRDLKEWSSIKP